MSDYSAALTPSAPKMLYTVPETAELLSISERTVFRLLAEGKLDSVLIRGARRIPYSSMQEYVSRALDAARNESQPFEGALTVSGM